MRSSFRHSSFFGDVRNRELHGLRVRKILHLGDLSSEPDGLGTGGVVSVEHRGVTSLPFAVSFCKESMNGHLLAVGDEDGFVSLYDARRRMPSMDSYSKNAEDVKVCDWTAHSNAIFDVCWIKDGSRVLTGSGEQKIKLWDIESRTCIGILAGHSGSVKSISVHPSNPDIIVSGSRDGSFARWDLRCNLGCLKNGEAWLSSIDFVENAHAPNSGILTRRVRSRGNWSLKPGPISITSVLYLRDAVSITTAGALNSIIKFWDTRNLTSCVTQTSPGNGPSAENETAGHGISSLSQDSHGVHIAASCTDHRIYLYDVLSPNKGATKVFAGNSINSFYVKSALSPDGTHVLAGSGDDNAYIWQVKYPDRTPVELTGHSGEVTAVDWCSSDIGKVVTCADDSTVRVWNIRKGGCISTNSPSSTKKRTAARRSTKCSRKLVLDDILMHSTAVADSSNPSEQTIATPSAVHQRATEVADSSNPPEQTMATPSAVHQRATAFSTPESGRKRILMEGLEVLEKREAEYSSPSSVLNPPPSVKRRTILDYFPSAP